MELNTERHQHPWCCFHLTKSKSDCAILPLRRVFSGTVTQKQLASPANFYLNTTKNSTHQFIQENWLTYSPNIQKLPGMNALVLLKVF